MSRRKQQQQLKSQSFKRSLCPVACALDVIGDKWTLLIIRDLTFGKRRYSQFLESKEGITTNILANRLQKLEAAGLIYKTLYQDNPKRYEYHLTETGAGLKPVMGVVAEWAECNLVGTSRPLKYSHN